MFRGDIAKYLSGFIHDLIPLSSNCSLKAPLIMAQTALLYTHRIFINLSTQEWSLHCYDADSNANDICLST